MYDIDFSGLKDMTNLWVQKIWNDRNRYMVFKGGGGSGKSFGVAQLLVYRMIAEEGHNVLVVRKVGNTLRESCFSLLKGVISLYGCEKLFTINKTEMSIECINGNKFIMRGLDDPEKIKSIYDITDMWIEEASELTVEDLHQLDIRLRGKTKNPKQMFITFNPISIDHWLKVEFFDNKKPNATIVETTYKDNKFLDEEAKQVLENFKITDPYYYMVYCLNQWGIAGGNYFKEFREDIHVMQPFDIPLDWTRYVCLDYGLDMLAVLWIAVDTYKKAYIYKELYQSNLIISEAAKKILEVNEDDKVAYFYAPPDLWNRRQETGKSAADIFYENGVRLLKSNNDRVQGWYNVKEWIKPYDARDEQTGDKIITANMRMFPCCKNLIRCMPQIQTDENNPNDVSDKNHELSHICDALRYFCNMIINPSAEPKKKKKELPFALRTDNEVKQNIVMEW